MRISAVLKGHELFRSLNVNELNLLSTVSGLKRFDRDDIVFRQDTPVSHVFLNLEGMIHLQVPIREAEISATVARVSKGELFGISSLLGSEHYTTMAKAFVPTDVLAIEANPLREILLANSLVGFHIMTQVGRTYFERYVGVMERLQGVVEQVI